MNIVIATHGKLADGFLDALNIVLGDGDYHDIYPLSLDGEGIDHFKSSMTTLMNKIHDERNGTLVFVDLFGGTPWNSSAINKMQPKRNNVEIICGINLAILLTAIELREEQRSLQEIVQELEQLSGEYVRKYEHHVILNHDDE